MKRNPKKVLIAVPIKDGMLRWETLFSLLRTAEIGYEVNIIPFGGCDVCHARNLAFHHWRTRSDAGRLQFLDSDLSWTPEKLKMLWDSELPVVAGCYPLSDSFLRWSFQGKVTDSIDPNYLIVEEVCTGALSIRWDVLEKLIRFEDEFVIEDAEYRGEIGYEITKMGVFNRRRYSEDFYLSKLIRELGYFIFVDSRCWMNHHKMNGLLNRYTKDEIEKSLKNPQTVKAL
jgi:hypothetical protein